MRMYKVILFKDKENHIFYNLCDENMVEIHIDNFNDVVINITNCTPFIKNGKLIKRLNEKELVTLRATISKSEIRFLLKNNITLDIILGNVIENFRNYKEKNNDFCHFLK